MIEINLIPDVKKELIKANKTRNVVVTFAIFAGVIAVAIVAILGIVIGGQVITSKGQDKAITDESKRLNETADLSKILTIQNQLGAIPTVADAKPITSRVLGLLDVIYASGSAEVEISTMGLDVATNTLTIEGQTRAGYPGVETIVKALNIAEVTYTLRQDGAGESSSEEAEAASEGEAESQSSADSIQTVKLLSEAVTSGDVSYGRDGDGVDTARFQLTLILSPEFLDVKNENVRVVIRNGGNVTDSYLGIPKSIFANPAGDINKQGEQ